MRRIILTWLSCVLVGSLPSAGAAGPQSADDSAGPQLVRPTSGFAWPVTPHTVVRRFQPPAEKWGPGHRGVDLGAPAGTPVLAPSGGVVTFSGVIAGRGVVSIRHPQGFNTTYEPVDDRIAVGSRVERGTRIGVLNASHTSDGPCPGACLHWGYRVAKDVYLDPLTLLGLVRPVLLPPIETAQGQRG